MSLGRVVAHPPAPAPLERVKRWKRRTDVEPVSTGFAEGVRDTGPGLRLRLVGGTVELSWARVYNAVSYTAYRAEAPTFVGEISLGNTTATTTADPAPAGDLLYYRLAGVDCQGVEGP